MNIFIFKFRLSGLCLSLWGFKLIGASVHIGVKLKESLSTFYSVDRGGI